MSQLMTISEAARECGIGVATIQYWTRVGKVTIVQNFHGHVPRWLVPLDRVRELATEFRARQQKQRERAEARRLAGPRAAQTRPTTEREPEPEHPSACDEVAASLDGTDLLTPGDRVELARRYGLLEARRCAA